MVGGRSYQIPSDQSVTLESSREWKELSVFRFNQCDSSNGSSSMVFCTSLGKLDLRSHDSLRMTMPVAMECEEDPQGLELTVALFALLQDRLEPYSTLLRRLSVKSSNFPSSRKSDLASKAW